MWGEEEVQDGLGRQDLQSQKYLCIGGGVTGVSALAVLVERQCYLTTVELCT